MFYARHTFAGRGDACLVREKNRVWFRDDHTAADRESFPRAQFAFVDGVQRARAPAPPGRAAFEKITGRIGEALDIEGDVEMAEGVALPRRDPPR